MLRGHTNSWKTWPLWNKGKLPLPNIVQENASQKNAMRDTKPMNKVLLWAVQSQDQRRSTINELSTDTHRVRPPHSSQGSGGCGTITEEREVSWSRQHPSRTGPSRWRGRNHRSHDNLWQDLADRRMANTVDPVLSHHTAQESQPAEVPEQSNDQLISHPSEIMQDHTDHCLE